MLVNVWFSIKGEWQSTERTREKTLLKTFALPPPCLSSSKQWSLLHAILQEQYLELRFSIPWSIISECPYAAFWAAPVMCHHRMVLWQLFLTCTAPSQPIPEAETEADFTASSTSNLILCLWVTRFRICSLCKTAFVLQPAFWRGLGQYSAFVVQEFSHWISYSTQGCRKWWFLNFTFLSKRMLRYLIRKQTI